MPVSTDGVEFLAVELGYNEVKANDLLLKYPDVLKVLSETTLLLKLPVPLGFREEDIRESPSTVPDNCSDKLELDLINEYHEDEGFFLELVALLKEGI